MALVNVDLSEYDAMRNRVSELEEQVKELKEENASLKQNAKVILRKETVIETASPIEEQESSWHKDSIIGYHDSVGRINRPNRRVVESSESYINFEDVRMKVEQDMEAEVKRSIYERDCAAKSCMEKEQDLETKYQQKLSELESEARMRISTREHELAKKYRDVDVGYNCVISEYYPEIISMAKELRDDLNKRFIKPKSAIELAERIIGVAEGQLTYCKKQTGINYTPWK